MGLKRIWINYHFVFFKSIHCCFTLLSVEETWCNNFHLEKFINPQKLDFIWLSHVTNIVIATWKDPHFHRKGSGYFFYDFITLVTWYELIPSERGTTFTFFNNFSRHLPPLNSAAYFDPTHTIYEFWRFLQPLQSAAINDPLLKFTPMSFCWNSLDPKID